MNADALFPHTAAERRAALTAFIEEERRHRFGMVERHPERADYWLGRVAQCDEMLEHLAALSGRGAS
jgi:hypothetical protein